MHYFSNKFSKIAEGSPPLAPPLNFDIGNLMLRDLDKKCFSNWLWRNRTFKKSDVVKNVAKI